MDAIAISDGAESLPGKRRLEVLRARVRALGGNCLLSYRIENFDIDNLSDEHTYFLLSAGGDAVLTQPVGPSSLK